MSEKSIQVQNISQKPTNITQKIYPSIQDFQISSNSEHYIFTTSDIKGKSFIVKDGQEIWKEYDDVSWVSMSPDGKSFAYVAEQNDKTFIVKDGQEIWKDYSNVSNPIFSLDSKHLAYKAYNSIDWIYDTFLLVKDGQEIWKEYDNVSDPIFSPDWKSFAYRAYLNDQIDWLAYNFLVKDGQEIWKEYKNTNTSLSADWPSFLFLTEGWIAYAILEPLKDNSFFIIGNKIVGQSFKNIEDFSVSKDGKHHIYFANNDWKGLIVMDEKVISDKYQIVSDPAISSDWMHFAFTACEWYRSDIKCFVVLDWKIVSEKYDKIESNIFSEDNTLYSIVDSNGSQSGFEIKIF